MPIDNDSSDLLFQDFTIDWTSGVGDISLPNSPEDGFVLDSVPYMKYKDTTYNRYLLDGHNRSLFKEKLLILVESIQENVKLLNQIKFQNMEFQPRTINIIENQPWGGIHRALNNEFCWLRDTRYTKTGRIAKNAYELHFADNPIRFFLNDYEASFGELFITAEHKINRGRLIQWKGKNSLFVSVKEADNKLIITSVEKDGQNILNT